MKYYAMEETREFLERIGMPSGDLYNLPTSKKRFEDGGQYRFEVPGIQGPCPMKALLEALDGYGIQIHRVTQTQGIMRLLDSEIEQMLEYAYKWNVELLLATGPRATIDKCFDEITGVYRLLPTSASHNPNIKRMMDFLVSTYEVRCFFAKKYGREDIGKTETNIEIDCHSELY